MTFYIKEKKIYSQNWFSEFKFGIIFRSRWDYFQNLRQKNIPKSLDWEHCYTVVLTAIFFGFHGALLHRCSHIAGHQLELIRAMSLLSLNAHARLESWFDHDSPAFPWSSQPSLGFFSKKFVCLPFCTVHFLQLTVVIHVWLENVFCTKYFVARIAGKFLRFECFMRF